MNFKKIGEKPFNICLLFVHIQKEILKETKTILKRIAREEMLKKTPIIVGNFTIITLSGFHDCIAPYQNL